MRAGEQAATRTVAWNAAVDTLRASTAARRSPQVLRDEQQAKTTRLAVVLSLFLVLLAAALLVGGRVVIDPLLQTAAQRREAERIGKIVLTMPDGTFCRHLSFDNQTAELTEGMIEQCPRDHKVRASDTMGFSWGAR